MREFLAFLVFLVSTHGHAKTHQTLDDALSSAKLEPLFCRDTSRRGDIIERKVVSVSTCESTQESLSLKYDVYERTRNGEGVVKSKSTKWTRISENWKRADNTEVITKACETVQQTLKRSQKELNNPNTCPEVNEYLEKRESLKEPSQFRPLATYYSFYTGSCNSMAQNLFEQIRRDMVDSGKYCRTMRAKAIKEKKFYSKDYSAVSVIVECEPLSFTDEVARELANTCMEYVGTQAYHLLNCNERLKGIPADPLGSLSAPNCESADPAFLTLPNE